MKVDLRDRYSFIGKIPKSQPSLTLKGMLTSDDYFPHNTPFVKKLLYITLRVIRKVKNKILGNPKIVPTANVPFDYTNHIVETPIHYFVLVFTYSDLSIIHKTLTSINKQKSILSSHINIISSVQLTEKVDHFTQATSDKKVLEVLKDQIEQLDNGDICIMQSGDQLSHHYIQALNSQKGTCIAYTGYVNEKNGDQSFDKPGYSPDTLRSFNYIGEIIYVSLGLFSQVKDKLTLYDYSSFTYSFNLFATSLAEKVIFEPRVSNQIESIRQYDVDTQLTSLTEFLDYNQESYSTVHKTSTDHFIVDYTFKKDKVSIIIPTKNRADILSVCLNSIFTKSNYSNFEVIVIDNNSDEDSLGVLLNEFKNKHPLQFKVQKDNGVFNFARLMNEATKIASGDYYLFLNNDTEILSFHWLEAMLSQAQRENVGVVGPKLLYPNDTIQHCGVEFHTTDTNHVFVEYDPLTEVNRGQVQSVWNYPALTAACFMINRDKFDRVNGFDTQFQVSYNDIDLCLRLDQLGYNNVYIPHVSLYHYESISRGNPLAIPKTQKQHIKEYNAFVNRWCQSLKV